ADSALLSILLPTVKPNVYIPIALAPLTGDRTAPFYNEAIEESKASQWSAAHHLSTRHQTKADLVVR
ncbi:MAG: hypothetical protein OXP69_07420, partial [Spirochaetaceae bacterium]|nr:hypothetical protein [Spirochaetaceae bacterium]